MNRFKQTSISLILVITFSKLVGMLRDIVLANYFGTSNISDAYLIAVSVPSLLFFFIGHSLSTAYIPMYSKLRQEQGALSAQRFSNNLLNCALILSGLIAAVLLLFPFPVIKLFAAGFDNDTASIAARLIRISAPSIFLMTLVNIWGGYLQANKEYLAPAAISLPRNFAIVISVIVAFYFGVDWLGVGLLLAYILEALFLLPPALKKGYRYQITIDLRDKDLQQTLYLVMPILIGMCVGQINKIIDRSMASMVIEGGISALTYASVINNAVQEILVTGVITILFSDCSELVAKNQHEKVKEKVSYTVNSLAFLLLPASVGILVLARPLVELILCRGAFDQRSLDMTVGALRCYTLGLTFLGLRDTFVKIFYAYKSTKVTTIVSTISIVINILLNILLGSIIGINGLALATSAAAIINCLILFVLLRKKIGDFDTRGIIVNVMKSICGCLIMGVTVFFANICLARQYSGIWAMMISVVIGCIVYFSVELLLRNKIMALSPMPLKRSP